MITACRVLTRKHLELISDDIKTSWEGDIYKPKNEEAYQEVRLLTANDKHFGLSECVARQYILNINLFYPSNVGVYDIEKKEDAIKEHFKRGTRLTDAKYTVKVDDVDTRNLGTIKDREVRNVSIFIKQY